MKVINIVSKTHGSKDVLVSDTDYDNVISCRWYIVKIYDLFYAKRTDKPIFMHRFILNAGKDTIVDHKDHNGLNNQRNNLRSRLSF